MTMAMSHVNIVIEASVPIGSNNLLSCVAFCLECQQFARSFHRRCGGLRATQKLRVSLAAAKRVCAEHSSWIAIIAYHLLCLGNPHGSGESSRGLDRGLSVLVIARHPNTVFEGRRLLFVYLEALSKVGRQAIHLHGQGLACQVKRKVKISGLVRHLGQLDQTKGTKSRSGDREICIVV